MPARKSRTRELAEDELNLGYDLFHGVGVRGSRPEGLRHYRKAARVGHPKAMFNLGLCFELGRGVAPRSHGAPLVP